MSFCCRLYRYFQFWWRTEIEWRRLFSEPRDNYVLLSVLFLAILALLHVFLPYNHIAYFILQIIFVFSVILFAALFFEWIVRKWRILFPKQTLLYPNVGRGIGFAWREENPHNRQLPANFVGAIVRLPEPGFQTPRPLRPFAPPALEYTEVQAQIYRRSRYTDSVFSRSQARALSDPRSLYTHTPRRVRHSSHHHSFQNYRSRNSPEEPCFVGSSTCSAPESSQGPTPKRQVTSAEVHASMWDRGKRPMEKSLDLCSQVNYGASTSKCTEENYICGTSDESLEKWEEMSLPETVADLPEDGVSDCSTETSPSPEFKNNPQGSPPPYRRSSPMKYSDSEFSDTSPGKENDSKVDADSHSPNTIKTSKCVKRPQLQLEVDASEDPETVASAQFERMSKTESCEESKRRKEDVLQKYYKEGSPPKQSCSQSETGQKRNSPKPENPVSSSSRKLSPKQIAEDSSSKAKSKFPQLHSLLTPPKIIFSVTSSKRKKETSSEEEDGSLHDDYKRLPLRSVKPRSKIPKIQETSESDNSEEN